MSEEINDEQLIHDDYITDEERKHLISGLHRILAWVGESLPDNVNIDGRDIDIHETIWQCIHKKDFTEEEKCNFRDIANSLEKKEKDFEEVLQRANLKRTDADRLYHEIASIMRAVTDIRECETGKVTLKECNEDTIQGEKHKETAKAVLKSSIDDTKRWLNFMKTVEKK